ncbi:MAG: M23 family metallopeptidase [Bacteroidaceae bacterium]|nr:M23 family metallopeptidase [Bacteroidaceae bacterium]
MKKKFILAIFGISLLFMACQEDSYYNDYDMGDENSSILTEAMKLIEDNHDFVSLPDLDKTLKGGSATRSSGSNQSLRYEEEDFIFDWGEADVMESKLAEVVIAPVRYNKEMALRTITMEGNSRKRETTPLHSMLYMRKMLETGQTHAYILSFAPDRDYINACEENGEELQLYPNPQGSDFSGILFFSTIYGEITHGIRYENGRKCYYIMPRSERNRNFIEQYRSEHCSSHQCDSVHTHIKMSLEFITFISATRSTYSNNSEDYDNLTCSFCGKNVNDCTCVEIVECGVCRRQPCICDENPEVEEEEEQRCYYCGFLIEFCQCYNLPGTNPSGPLGPSNPSGPTIPPIDPSLPGLGGNTGDSNENDKIPCQSDDGLSGNPLVSMRIAPPSNWNPRGGTWGITRYDENRKKTVFHQGIDLAAEEGTPIYSTHDGVVVAIKNDFDNDTYNKYKSGDYSEAAKRIAKVGNFIEIESTINGKTFNHVYWHLKKNNDNDLKVGDTVYTGTFIGYSGITGNASPSVPHLHYGIRVEGEGYVNPVDYIPVEYEKDSNGNSTINLKTDCE